MPVNTYSDGFPLTPLEAIEFSYFLSEGEKQEWREWLQSATIEQQNELVDILHSMWQDNQKQAVPSAFTTQQPVESPQAFPIANTNTPDTSFSNEVLPTPTPAPTPSATPPAPSPTSFIDNTFASDSQFQFVDETTAPKPAPKTDITQPSSAQAPSEPEEATNQATKNTHAENLAVLEASDSETKPQFEENFQAPDLTQAQVQPIPSTRYQPRPIPAAQPPMPIIEDEMEDEESEIEHPVTKPIMQSEDENQEFALKKMANTKYSPNPILEDKTPPRDEFVYKNVNNNTQNNQSKTTEKTESASNQVSVSDRARGQQTTNTKDIRNQSRTNPSSDNRDNNFVQKENRPKPLITEERKQSFFGGSQLRQSAAKNLLDEVYKAYQNSKTKTVQISKESDDKFAALLDRIMQVISNSDQLATYYETVIEKIIEVNDKVVDQAKEIQLLKNNTQSRGGVSLQDQVDEMRDDIERLNRDTRTMRIEQRRKYDEITSQVASFDADSFKMDKTDHVIDRLKSDIFQLQQKLNIPGETQNSRDTTTKTDYSNSSKNSQNSNQNRRTNQNNKDS